MLARTVEADTSPEQILHDAIAREREARELLERAARLVSDPQQRALFERLAKGEEDALRELEHEQDLLDAEAFVQRALDC